MAPTWGVSGMIGVLQTCTTLVPVKKLCNLKCSSLYIAPTDE